MGLMSLAGMDGRWNVRSGAMYLSVHSYVTESRNLQQLQTSCPYIIIALEKTGAIVEDSEA